MPARDRRVVALSGLYALLMLALLVGLVVDDDTPTVTVPTPTTTAPWCEGESLVVPGAGVVDYAPRCDQPPQHDPPGTGPTTGPNGEPAP